MSLLNIAEMIGDHQPRPFIAPIPEADHVMVFSLQDGIPYWFKVRDRRPGWWLLSPFTRGWVEIERGAYPMEYMEYMMALPRFYVIALFQTGEYTWLCVPFNLSDAAQRGWGQGKPQKIHLTRGQSIQSFDVMISRQMDQVLLFDSNYWSGKVLDDAARMRADYLIQAHQAELERLARERERESIQQDTEGRIRHQLSLAGADLCSWSELPEGYSVTWEYAGAEYTMEVNKNLTIASAGICLSGTDSAHDLVTIVETMQQARRLHRFDLDERHYL